MPSALFYNVYKDKQVLYYCKGVSPVVAGQTETVNKYFWLPNSSLNISINLDPKPEPVPPAKLWNSMTPRKWSAYSAHFLSISATF